ncbi:MAG: cytochrome c family protein [Pseudomonadota bacterium]
MFKQILTAAAATMVFAGGNAIAMDGDIAEGEKVFRKCQACHVVDDMKNRVGPHLMGVVGRDIAAVEKFKYSKGMVAYGEENGKWTQQLLTDYLEAPRTTVKGTKMAFAGLKKEEDRVNVVAYIMSNGVTNEDGEVVAMEDVATN